jgi:hypothetical protein
MGALSGRKTVLLELPQVVQPVSYLRGTTMAASLQVLEEQGLSASFWRVLPAAHRDALRELVAASWVEVAVGNAYYTALDSLALSTDQMILIGRQAAERVQSAFIATLIRGMRGAVTPATVMSRMDTLWARSFRGGAVRVVEEGPKDMRVEVHGAEFLGLRYTRVALTGYYEQTLASTAKRIYVRELAAPAQRAAAWLVSWA